MLFDTPVYFVFLFLVVSVYWRLPFGRQNLFLLGCSYFFYGWWDWRFLLLMAGSTVADYFFSLQIARTEAPSRRRAFLVVSLLMNFGFLGFFKYFNFFVESFTPLAAALGLGDKPGLILRIVLPAGISFYTFQAVAYIVDVYSKRLEPARSLVDYALFISLFPHLVAGPIQRPSHLLPQVQAPRTMAPGQVFDGLMLIVTGLFRKCVIADNCALLANAAFGGQLGEPGLAVLLLGTYAFAVQIYGDFSGYSDIARGSAQLMGFHFMVNFRQPYLATSLSDFWRRWHVSLSTWLRDYLYIPLGGSRDGERRTYRNLAATMILGGLWHGANWTFVAWGALHGAGLALERALGLKAPAGAPPSPGAPLPCGAWGRWARRALVFHLVCAAWVLFRAGSLQDALEMLGGAGAWNWTPAYGTAAQFLALFAAPMLLLDLRLEKHGEEYPFQNWPGASLAGTFAFRTGVAALLLVMVMVMGSTKSNAFIYFQF